MPTYIFINLETEEFEEHVMSIMAYDAFKEANPHLHRYIDSPPAVSFNGKTFGGLDSQTDNTWKEVLAKIGEKNPGSNLANKYSKNKTIKQSQTEQVVNRLAKKATEIKEERKRR